MAKSANPIDQHRRAERKKELNKNKKARISARDAKVAATRSLDEIQSEIRELERRKDKFGKNGVGGGGDDGDNNSSRGGLDSTQVKKLERLRKELKIVKAESVKRAEAAEQQRIAREKAQLASMKTAEGVKAINESKYSLVERYASVYYDPVMNPYGVPPPGQPKLYFGVNSATTMDLNQAVVPEKYRDKMEKEGGVSNNQRKRRWDDGPQSGQNGGGGVAITVNGQVMQQQQQQFAPPPPPPQFPPPPPPPNQFPPPPPPPTQFPPPPPSDPSFNSQQNLSAPPPPPPIPPPPPPPVEQPKNKSIPSLPKPSASVVRASRKTKSKVLADIWASAEEMDYDTSLQSSADYAKDEAPEPYLPRWQRDKMNKKKKDDSKDVNDPCCPSADGYSEYRNSEQIERQALESRNHRQKDPSLRQDSHDVNPEQSTSWYYADNSTGAIQGPFTGAQMHGWKSAGFFPETTPVRRGEDGEFVAMGSVDFMAIPDLSVKDEKTGSFDNEDNVSQEGQSDALAASNGEEEEEGDCNIPESEISEPAGDENETKADPCGPPPEDDEEALEVDLCVPPPSDDEDDRQEVDVCLPPPSDDEDECAEVDTCLPPPSDDEENQAEAEGETFPSYPAPDEDNGADVPYPVDDAVPYPIDDAVPYPVDVDYPVDVAYPVDGAYGYPDTDGAYEGDEIAAVAPYPGTDILASDALDNNNGKGPPAVETKKKFDGDKVVVGFVPSTVKRKGAKKKKSDGQ